MIEYIKDVMNGAFMKHINLLAALLAALLLASCAQTETGKEYPLGNIDDSVETQTVSDETIIELQGEAVNIEGSGASFENNILTITKGGVYTLSGELDGGIVVNVSKSEKVELVLKGASVSNPNSSAIYVASADKVIIELAEGTENVVSDGETYALDNDAEPNACIYSADDMTIKGTGKLSVYAKCRNGIQTKNDLRIKGGEITVTAPNNALKGKDSVEITDGTIKITGADDGIKSDNETEEGRGIVTITGGEIKITCQDDGIQAYRSVRISGSAKLEIDARDKSVNCDGDVDIDENCLVGNEK